MGADRDPPAALRLPGATFWRPFGATDVPPSSCVRYVRAGWGRCLDIEGQAPGPAVAPARGGTRALR